MSTLIVTILAVVLIAAIAIAGMYYGGSSIAGSQSDATAAKVINTSSQISAAIDLYRTDERGAMPASPQDLVTGGYLRQLPDPSSWQFSSDAIERTALTKDECGAINKKITGNSTIPSCTDAGPGFVGCCSRDATG